MLPFNVRSSSPYVLIIFQVIKVYQTPVKYANQKIILPPQITKYSCTSKRDIIIKNVKLLTYGQLSDQQQKYQP